VTWFMTAAISIEPRSAQLYDRATLVGEVTPRAIGRRPRSTSTSLSMTPFPGLGHFARSVPYEGNARRQGLPPERAGFASVVLPLLPARTRTRRGVAGHGEASAHNRRPPATSATAVIRHTKDKPTPMANCLVKKPFRVVSVALANKLARIAWVVLTRKEAYRSYQLAA
jgi:hypothetical protein